jgi:hypothetical protein
MAGILGQNDYFQENVYRDKVSVDKENKLA